MHRTDSGASALLSHVRAVAKRNLCALGDIALETMWPTRCAVCDAQGVLLCERCLRALPFIDTCRACPRCGAAGGIVQCTECNGFSLAGFDGELPLTAAASALVCTEETKRIVTTYKDRGERRLAEPMAQIMALYLPPAWLKRSPAVTFIPASRKALARRGFDHNETLAATLARMLDLPLAAPLERPHARDQRELGKRDRLSNMRIAFTLRAEADLPRSVVLVDDIITTGATLYSAAGVLREGGVEEVYGLSFARV